MNRKTHKKVKYSKRNNRGFLRYIIKQQKNKKNMKVKKYKINRRVRMYDGTYQTMTTRYTVTLTIEEARKKGLLE